MTRAEIQWRRLDQPANEHATIFSNRRVRVLAGVVDGTTDDRRVYNVQYTVRCTGDWATRDAVIDGHVGESRVNIAVSRNAATGAWMRDGLPQEQVEGCVDLDLGFSPITNTLPIRRLDLDVGEAATVRAAWLRFPDFKFEVLEQRYERIDVCTYIYHSDGGRFRAELEVGEMGIVVRYDRYWIGSVTPAGQR